VGSLALPHVVSVKSTHVAVHNATAADDAESNTFSFLCAVAAPVPRGEWLLLLDGHGVMTKNDSCGGQLRWGTGGCPPCTSEHANGDD
jgi:hypothetical protein